MEVQGPISDQFPSDSEDLNELESQASQQSETSHSASQRESVTRSLRSSEGRSDTDSSEINSHMDDDDSDNVTTLNSNLANNDKLQSQAQPSTSQGNSTSRTPKASQELGVEDTLEIVQQFMVEKGLIDQTMTPTQMRQFLQDRNERSNTNQNNTRRS